jgi:hypothetical protein
MYNPELRFLIAQENGEMFPFPFIDTHIFAAVIVVGINLFISSFVIMGIYKLAMILLNLSFVACQYLWSILTPGNEILEVALISSSIFAAGMWILAMNELSTKLDSTFEKLKNRLKEKDSRITELESELAALIKGKGENVMIVENESEDEQQEDEQQEDEQQEDEQQEDPINNNNN